MRVLVVNAGSSSLKLRILDGGDGIAADARLAAPSGAGWVDALDDFLAATPGFDAAGHRVVHGGSVFLAPVRVDDEVQDRLDGLADLAPLHNRPAIEAMRAVRRLRPDLAQVACFDTAFHAGMPPEASTYALPRRLARRFGLRRFGFHGLSHAWASERMAALMGRSVADLRLVTAHIGAGASLAAVQGGRSVDTTMGFTPLEGLVMATRSGSVDPGLVLWLQRHAGFSAGDLEGVLEQESGLRGLTGSADLAAVIEGADGGDGDCRLALGVYLHRLRGGIAAMVSALGGIDGLVFTGGAGEASSRLRADVCGPLGFLGLSLDPVANDGRGDRLISRGSVAAAVVESREDLQIARQVRSVLGR